jgi:hypothetical protein
MTPKNTINVEAEVEARRKRAEEAITSGKYRVTRVQKGQWRVENGGGTAYTVVVQDGKPSCDCPDFQNRGSVIGTCKHIEMIRALVRNSKPAQPASPAPSTSPNGHEPSKEASGEGQQPQPQPQPAQPDQAAPTGEGLDPVDPVVPFGRHRGKRLSEAAREDPDFIFWVIRKMEVRSDADQAMKEAARSLAERIVQEKASQISPDEVVVPFGEEKGTPLTKCHPKWVAVLAKKGLEDAFTLQDAVTYEVARRLQQRRLQERRKKASSLDAEVLIGAVSVAVRQAVREAVLEALEAARQAAADSEAITADLADLRRRVERLEKAVSALRPLAEREAALAAR